MQDLSNLTLAKQNVEIKKEALSLAIENEKQNKKLNKVIVRPMTNLNGMGRGTYYLNDIDKISQISEKDFWCEV